MDLTDFDGDDIDNDGNGDGQYANAPCTGGQTSGCDDNCPGLPNPDQADDDGDGRGDACDCQGEDPGDRRPAAVAGVRVSRSGSDVHVTWSSRGTYADLYSVVRGTLSDLRSVGDYGSCLMDGVEDSGFDDTAVPPLGEAFFYLVQGQDFDCGGIGSAGTASNELERTPTVACTGATFSELFAASETTTAGTRSGSLADTTVSDDVFEGLTESSSGPILRLLSHTWTFSVPAGNRISLHAEGWRTTNTAGETFFFEWSTDGVTFYPTSPFFVDPRLETVETDRDSNFTLPPEVSGTVHIRIEDTVLNDTVNDTAWIDTLWIRLVP